MFGQTTRRRFIQNGMAYVTIGLGIPQILVRAAEAAESAPAGSPAASGKILVVIEMSGGNDGLNTVIPYTDAGYARNRPVIGIPAASVRKISSSVGLHPAMGAMGNMFDKGQLAVVTGVGYPNPNRSHFFSMDVWQTATEEASVTNRTGWLARYFDCDGHFKGDPLSGVTLGSSLPLALTSVDDPVSVIGDGNNYGFQAIDGDRAKHLRAIESMYTGGTAAIDHADFVRNVGHEAYLSSEELKRAIAVYDVKAASAAKYPIGNGLANSLQTVAKLITGGVSTRVYYLNIGGFDTHADQPRVHAQVLNQLSEAISAFYADLELQGRANDVTLMTFSEFGRRVKENGSAGTDHGAASVLFVAGAGVKGGVYGDYPSLTDLDQGDLKHHTDFRSVYATLLDKWLGTPSNPILGGDYAHLNFV